MMSGIQGKDTKPEVMIRKALHRRGFRYCIYVKSLPGKPDLVFPKYSAVIQINGCFWHGHDCDLFKWPSTRPKFWKNKISDNRRRDLKNNAELKKMGWRVLTIWECAMKGREKQSFEKVVKRTSDWLTGNKNRGEIKGKSKRKKI